MHLIKQKCFVAALLVTAGRHNQREGTTDIRTCLLSTRHFPHSAYLSTVRTILTSLLPHVAILHTSQPHQPHQPLFSTSSFSVIPHATLRQSTYISHSLPISLLFHECRNRLLILQSHGRTMESCCQSACTSPVSSPTRPDQALHITVHSIFVPEYQRAGLRILTDFIKVLSFTSWIPFCPAQSSASSQPSHSRW